MESRSTAHEMESLLELAPWVQELARKLVRDPDQAEDLAQDVLVAALETPRAAIRSQRSWLAGVLRNLLNERLRRDHRREAREEDAARPPETDATGELVARMTAHQAVVTTLMDLPEHYRTTLLRRYFDGQRPQFIAAEMQVPVSTVKTRLARGLELMRARLDHAAGGDGQQWLAGLAPLISVPIVPPSHAAEAGTGAAVAPSGLGLVALGGALASLVFGAIWLFGRDETTPVPELAVLAPHVATGVDAEELGTLARGDGAPTDERSAAAPTGAEPPAPVTRRPRADRGQRVRGRVVLPTGDPLAGVVVELRAESGPEPRAGTGATIAVTDRDGAFELAGLSSDGLVRVVGDAWVTLFAGRALGGGAPLVVVAPPGRIEGRVVDADGRAVAGARVAVRTPASLRAELGPELRSAGEVRYGATTARDGAFAIEPAPATAGLELCVEALATAGGAREVCRVLSGAALEVHELELPGPTAGAAILGRVVTAAGLAAEGVHVVLGGRSTRTDAGGSFAVTFDGELAGQRPQFIAAWSPGHGAALHELAADDRGRELVLELSGTTRSIRGLVRDRRGQPVPNAFVWLADPSFVAGAEVERPDGTSWLVAGHADLVRARPGPFVVECALAGRERESWPHATSGSDGRFELTGLLDREYALAGLSTGRLLAGRLDAVVPGAGDVELVLERIVGGGRRSGRVVDPAGEPVAGVQVSVVLPGFRLWDGERELYGVTHHEFASATDEAGRFFVEDLPPDAGLAFSSGAILPRTLEPDPIAEAGEAGELALEVVVRPALALRVELARPDEADAFRALDAAGEPSPLARVRGLDLTWHDELAIAGGRSEEVRVDAAVRAVELRRAGAVVRTVPVRRGDAPFVVR